MKVGDQVSRVSRVLGEYDPFRDRVRPARMKGRVEYIHPKGRYHVVRFDFSGGSVRESFR